jgi:hypothetical protein
MFHLFGYSGGNHWVIHRLYHVIAVAICASGCFHSIFRDRDTCPVLAYKFAEPVFSPGNFDHQDDILSRILFQPILELIIFANHGNLYK